MQINIAAPDIHIGDAVGNHCIALSQELNEKGHLCRLYGQRWTSESIKIRSIERLIEKDTIVNTQELLIVVHSIYDPYLEKLLSLKERKICYFHGITPPELIEEYDPITAINCKKGYKQLKLFERFDYVVTNSMYNKNILKEYIDQNRISIVPPVSSKFKVFQQSKRTYSPGSNIDGQIRILVLGRVVPHKNIEDAIIITSMLTKKGMDTKLHLVGNCLNEDYNNYLQGVAREWNVDDKVHIYGAISDEELLEQYKLCDLLLVTSKHEGFCVPVLEAMHLGMPVIVRSGTAAEEVAGGAGIVFDTTEQAASRILKMVSDKERECEIVRKGRHRSRCIIDSSKNFPIDV